MGMLLVLGLPHKVNFMIIAIPAIITIFAVLALKRDEEELQAVASNINLVEKRES